MADLAKMAGVSITTVSHVLNDTRFVAAEKCESVLAAVEQSGYTPNNLARSIATSTTESIGLAIPALSTPAFADLLQPIEAEVRATRFSLLLADTDDDPQQELRVVKALHSRRVDGILIAPSKRSSPAMEYLTKYEIPTVVVDRFVSEKFDQVGTENTLATARLTEHLIVEGGFTRIALISGTPGLSTTTERLRGYQDALQRHGLALDPQLVISGRGDPNRTAEAVQTLMSSSAPPTALITGNNMMTIGALRALNSLGIEVPGDLAVAAFDDFEWADFFRPRLTVVRQASQEIGQTAVQLLIQRIADPSRPPRTLRFPTEFVHRESCGCGRG